MRECVYKHWWVYPHTHTYWPGGRREQSIHRVQLEFQRPISCSSGSSRSAHYRFSLTRSSLTPPSVGGMACKWILPAREWTSGCRACVGCCASQDGPAELRAAGAETRWRRCSPPSPHHSPNPDASEKLITFIIIHTLTQRTSQMIGHTYSFTGYSFFTLYSTIENTTEDIKIME